MSLRWRSRGPEGVGYIMTPCDKSACGVRPPAQDRAGTQACGLRHAPSWASHVGVPCLGFPTSKMGQSPQCRLQGCTDRSRTRTQWTRLLNN